MLEKLKAQQTVIPAAAAAAGAGDARKVALKLPRAPPCYTEAIKLKDAAVGWGTPGEPGSKPLVNGVNLVIRRGQRVLVGTGHGLMGLARGACGVQLFRDEGVEGCAGEVSSLSSTRKNVAFWPCAWPLHEPLQPLSAVLR